MPSCAAPANEWTGVCRDEVLSLEALMLSRTFLYTLFHKALGGEPEEQLFKVMADGQTVSVVDEYAEADSSMASLRDFFSSLEGLADQSFVDAAKDEYTRVFIGPNRLPALPWESPYVSHEPVLFHKSTLAVRGAYRAHGWRLKRYLHVPDDHVSLLCCYMSRLSLETMQAFEAGRLDEVRSQMIEQRLFVDEHLCTWLAEYAQSLRDSDRVFFYGRLTEGLAAFARLDSGFASEVVAWIDEQVDLFGEGAQDEVGYSIKSLLRDEDRFEEAKQALGRLDALRLKNLEDNELCDVA